MLGRRWATYVKDEVNPYLLRWLGVAPAPATRFLGGQRRDLFRSLKIDTVLDVGANTGQYAREVRRLGFAGRIESFEPMLEAYEQLAAAAEPDARWTPHRLALGAEPGEAVLNAWHGSAGESSSLRTPSTDLVALLGHPAAQTVPVSTLDAWSAGHEVVGTRTWVKVDTQGFEAEVLRGGQRLLATAAGVELELPLRHWYEGAAGLAELLSTMHESGFVPVSIVTERFRSEWLGAVDVDALFVNKSLLPATR